MVKYLVVHNKHEGCYDFQFYQDEAARIRLTSITINPPKIYMFNTRDEAQDFFEEYINDVDCIDIRCKRGDDVEHIDYCTCGVIELDEEENPILFYNRKNQIFLLEHGPQLFVPPSELKSDIKNLNLTNRLIRKCKSLSREQRNRYIELGKYCQDCNAETPDDDDDKNEVISSNSEVKKEQEKPAAPVVTCIPCPVIEEKKEDTKKPKTVSKAGRASGKKKTENEEEKTETKKEKAPRKKKGDNNV
jgi:hypothetical protein